VPGHRDLLGGKGPCEKSRVVLATRNDVEVVHCGGKGNYTDEEEADKGSEE
jgi:hypothetical protein